MLHPDPGRAERIFQCPTRLGEEQVQPCIGKTKMPGNDVFSMILTASTNTGKVIGEKPEAVEGKKGDQRRLGVLSVIKQWVFLFQLGIQSNLNLSRCCVYHQSR